MAIYPELPPRVASHFGGSGEADGWSSKGTFGALMLGVVALIAGIGLALPRLIERLPASWVNLPHRDYWLAPERRAHTHGVLRTYLAWYGAATLVLIGAVLELVYRANLAADGGAARLSPHAWTVLASYLAFVAVWLTSFLRRFRR
jgi:uncharacterized membrane protein